MLRTFGRRLIRLLPVLFVVTLGTFFSLELVPGDPAVAILGDAATPADIARVHAELGLDDPIHERYLNWLGDTVSGDLGHSLIRPAQTVTDMIKQAFPLTAQLAVMALVLSLVVSIPIAIYTAYQAGSRADRITGTAASAIISVPPFVSALLLIFLFVFHSDIPRYLLLVLGLGLSAQIAHTAYQRSKDPVGREPLWIGLGSLAMAGLTVLAVNKFPAFPRIGFSRLSSGEGIGENLRHAALPTITLALTEIAVFVRLLRTDMIATLQEDFVLSAKAKGMPMWRVLFSDALRPSSFSLVTLAGVSLGRLLGGTVILESIFGIQGVGKVIVDAILANDFTVVQGGVLVLATAYVLINTLVDLSYAYLDPRVRRDR